MAKKYPQSYTTHENARLTEHLSGPAPNLIWQRRHDAVRDLARYRARALLSQQSARRCHKSEHGERHSSARARNMACARRSGSRYPRKLPVQLQLPPARDVAGVETGEHGSDCQRDGSYSTRCTARGGSAPGIGSTKTSRHGLSTGCLPPEHDARLVARSGPLV